MSERPYDIRERTRLFGREVIAFARENRDSSDPLLRRLFVQLVDAAGSVGANLEEAADAQSRADFIHKNYIALKEVRETKFWLRQIRDAEPGRFGTATGSLLTEAEALRRILTAIVITAKRNRKHPKNSPG